jgi:hypothetical protein
MAEANTEQTSLVVRRQIIARAGDVMSIIERRESRTPGWTSITAELLSIDVPSQRRLRLSDLFSAAQRQSIFAAVIDLLERRRDKQLLAAAEALAAENDTTAFAISGNVVRIGVTGTVSRYAAGEAFSSATPTLIPVPLPH